MVCRLILGAGGIYAAFLYYGTLQEDVFRFVSDSGEKFKYAWFLQLIGTINILALIRCSILNNCDFRIAV